MLTVFITSNQIPFMFMLCFAIIIIIVFPLYVHCIDLTRGMMRMRIPSYSKIKEMTCSKEAGNTAGPKPTYPYILQCNFITVKTQGLF